MQNENRLNMWASHAMWVRDYEGAFEFYSKYLELAEHLDIIVSYRVHFNLAILSTVLRKHEFADYYLGKLDEMFHNMQITRRAIKERTNRNIEEISQLISKETDSEKINNLLREYFPEEDDLLTFLVSPRYAKGFLRTAIRNAEMSGIPQVMKEGIFKYTLDSELYRVVGRAYSTQELTLENLDKIVQVEVLIENPNVFYVVDESSRVTAAVQREGRVLCQYSLKYSHDSEGAKQIGTFLNNLSNASSKQ